MARNLKYEEDGELSISPLYARKMFMLKETDESYYIDFKPDVKACLQAEFNKYPQWFVGKTTFNMTRDHHDFGMNNSAPIGRISEVKFYIQGVNEDYPLYLLKSNILWQGQEGVLFDDFVDNCAAILKGYDENMDYNENLNANYFGDITEEGRNIIKGIIEKCIGGKKNNSANKKKNSRKTKRGRNNMNMNEGNSRSSKKRTNANRTRNQNKGMNNMNE